MNIKHSKLFKQIIVGISFLFLSSCEDFLSSIRNENTQEIASLFYDLKDIDVCMNGAYGAFASGSYYGDLVLTDVLGSDNSAPTLNPLIQPDFTLLNASNYTFKYQSNIDDYQAGRFLQWGSFVNNNSNLIIQSINQHLPPIKNSVDTLNAQRLMGEAYLMRASVEYYNNYFVGRQYHFSTLDSLSTLYRKRPILSVNDTSEPRKTVAQVYRFLEEDLRAAINLLPSQFDKSIHPLAYQYRCKKDVAIAMLAKVFFQQNNFDSALVYVNKLLGNQIGMSTKFPLTQGYAYSKIFQTIDKVNYQSGTGNEVIMAFHGSSAFQPTTTTRWDSFQWTAFKNLQNGDLTQSKFRIVLDKSLQNIFIQGDTANDIRFKQLIYITTNFGKEYPAGQWTCLKAAYPTSNTPWLRSSEFHLMRAEIYFHKNNFPYAITELNLIRKRAGLVEIGNEIINEALYKNIIDERRREFCFENVRRWDNFRLASIAGSTYGVYLPEPFKSGKIPLGNRMNLITDTELPWNSNRFYSLIPQNEYLFNPALKGQ
ncbi:MAG: RagB/SusD family nutrient uptake outer membrane protein [Paludibacter sp.]|nr:RagB/SusD family nutrient uptake outer membrane protein [Paludibacter sp.]